MKTQKIKIIETGEVFEVNCLEKTTTKENLAKEKLAILGIRGKKFSLIKFLIENLNSENQILLTYAQIAQKSGISNQTIIEVYKWLIENKLIKKNGKIYEINRDFINFLSNDKNTKILINLDCQESQNLFYVRQESQEKQEKLTNRQKKKLLKRKFNLH